MTDKDTQKFTVPCDDKENMRRILRICRLSGLRLRSGCFCLDGCCREHADEHKQHHSKAKQSLQKVFHAYFLPP